MGTVKDETEEDVLLKEKADAEGLLKENRGSVVVEARAGVVSGAGAGADPVKATGVEAAARAIVTSLPTLMHRRVQSINKSTPGSKQKTGRVPRSVQKAGQQFVQTCFRQPFPSRTGMLGPRSERRQWECAPTRTPPSASTTFVQSENICLLRGAPLQKSPSLEPIPAHRKIYRAMTGKREGSIAE